MHQVAGAPDLDLSYLLDTGSAIMYRSDLWQAGVNVVIGTLAPAAVLLLIDRWSKRMVQLKSTGSPVLASRLLQIRYVTSYRRLYQPGAARALLVLIWLASVISAVALHWTGAWFQSRLSLIGLGLAFGGALGNLWDVLQHNYVVDFIDLRWWPVFNLADLGIIGGLVLAFG